MPGKPSIDLNDTSNRIIAGIALALIFIGGWWLIARNSMDTKGGDSTSTTTENAAPTGNVGSKVTPGSLLGPTTDDAPIIAGSDESLDVADQPAGMSVMVKSTKLVQTGWVAVRDSSGRTLGAGRFEAGVHMNIEVPLLRATTAGERYQALIYVDDGDKAFDLKKDILVTNDDGSVAGVLFSAQ